MTPIKRGPFQIDSHEDRARRPCRSPVALQGLSGIGIPSRKTQARHSGQLCSIRGKSGGARPGGEPYRRIGQTSGQLASRRALRVAEAWRFFSLVRLLIAVALKGDPLIYARADRAVGAGKRQKGIAGALVVLGARSRSDYEIQAVAVGTRLELEK